MSANDIFGEEDIIKNIKVRNHRVICESRKAECYQISSNLFIQKVIDLESIRSSFSEIQKNKNISTVHQDKINKVTMKNYKNYYFEEQVSLDLSPKKIKDNQVKLYYEFPIQQLESKKSSEIKDLHQDSFEKREVNTQLLDSSFYKNDRLPQINLHPVPLLTKKTLSQHQLQSTFLDDSLDQIQKKESHPFSKQNSKELNIQINDENKVQEKDFIETNVIQRHILKKKQSLNIQKKRNSNEQRSTSLFSQSNQNTINGRYSEQNKNTKQMLNSKINMDNDAQFGVDNIKDLKDIISKSHVKNELFGGQPKDLNDQDRLNLQKKYERSLKDKVKVIKQAYNFELDEKERQKIITRKQKYKNYIQDWKKSPSPPQKNNLLESEEISKKLYLSKNQMKLKLEASFLQNVEKNKNQIDELNQQDLVSSFFKDPYIQSPGIESKYQNSKYVASTQKKDKSEGSVLSQYSPDYDQQNTLQSLQLSSRAKSPLAVLLIEHDNLTNKQTNKKKAQPQETQDYQYSQSIQYPNNKVLDQQFMIQGISKLKESDDIQQQEPFLSQRSSGNKNQIQSLWKQKQQINKQSKRRRNISLLMDQSLQSRKNGITDLFNNCDINSNIISSLSSLQQMNDNPIKRSKNHNPNRSYEISLTPSYGIEGELYNSLSQRGDSQRSQGQPEQNQYRQAKIITNQPKFNCKKILNSEAGQKTTQIGTIIINTNKSTNQNEKQNIKNDIISFNSVMKKQNNSVNEYVKDSEIYSSIDNLDSYTNQNMKPIYKN